MLIGGGITSQVDYKSRPRRRHQRLAQVNPLRHAGKMSAGRTEVKKENQKLTHDREVMRKLAQVQKPLRSRTQCLFVKRFPG